jgi:polyadenylate-binding protein
VRKAPKATIIFKTHEKAAEARSKLNMKRLKGKALNIMWHERDNSVRYNNKANLFVKGISRDAQPREIYELFEKYGEIISCKICENDDGDLLGYGYINYYSLDSAENAIKELNKKKIWNSVLEIEHFQKKNERLQSNLGNNSIYIKNIPDKINENDIKNLFKDFGEITWSKVLSDNNGRKFAIIVYSQSESALKAKEEMNNKKIDDSDIGLYVDLLQKKSERKRILISKIGDINNKLNQEFKNCNLYIKNLPRELTE